jgi:hypothetical protein
MLLCCMVQGLKMYVNDIEIFIGCSKNNNFYVMRVQIDHSSLSLWVYFENTEIFTVQPTEQTSLLKLNVFYIWIKHVKLMIKYINRGIILQMIIIQPNNSKSTIPIFFLPSFKFKLSIYLRNNAYNIFQGWG